ncbi:hypothetical protein DIZ76_013251 [Coccidioides immitis]|nr:hypothetical protein DIZ76_013251 [Coccidioides immitis]
MSFARAVARSSIRQFSAQGPKPESRTQRFVANSALVALVVIPFIHPALESLRQKRSGNTHESNRYPPLCFRT